MCVFCSPARAWQTWLRAESHPAERSLGSIGAPDTDTPWNGTKKRILALFLFLFFSATAFFRMSILSLSWQNHRFVTGTKWNQSHWISQGNPLKEGERWEERIVRIATSFVRCLSLSSLSLSSLLFLLMHTEIFLVCSLIIRPRPKGKRVFVLSSAFPMFVPSLSW